MNATPRLQVLQILKYSFLPLQSLVAAALGDVSKAPFGVPNFAVFVATPIAAFVRDASVAELVSRAEKVVEHNAVR